MRVSVIPSSFLLLSVATALVGAQRKDTGDWPMYGGSPDRNMVSAVTGIPASWDLSSKKNIKWTAPIGTTTYGNPVVAGGKIFVATNNGARLRPEITGDKGVVICLDEATGRFLWQASHDKLQTGAEIDWPDQGVASTPLVDHDRLYYVSNQCQLVCADVEGFLDGENDGPVKDEKYHGRQDADIVWTLDMFKDFNVRPHELANCSPVGWKNIVFAATSNGRDEGLPIPSPDAPDLIAVEKDSGHVLWTRHDVGTKLLHGQWSSPAIGMVRGKPQLIFGGGDGWCYSYEPRTGRLLWRFNLNPPGAKYDPWNPEGPGLKNNIIATPVVFDDKVFLATGQDPNHGAGPGNLCAIDATGAGDVTESGRLWCVGGREFGRSLSTVAIADGLLYAADLPGSLYCFDVKTGKLYWQQDTFAQVWGSPFVVDGKVLLGNADGNVVVFRHGMESEVLAINDVHRTMRTTPVAANGVLYISSHGRLFAIAGTEDSAPLKAP